MGKASDLKNQLQIQIATIRSQFNSKKTLLQSQNSALLKKYISNGPDFIRIFETIVTAEVYLDAANQLITNLTILSQNADALLSKKTLPNEVNSSLEYCYKASKINKQKDLYNILKPNHR